MGERHNGGYGEDYREEYRGSRRHDADREAGFRIRNEDEFMPQNTGSRQRDEDDDREHGRSQRFDSSGGGRGGFQQRDQAPDQDRQQWNQGRYEQQRRVQGGRDPMPSWGRDADRQDVRHGRSDEGSAGGFSRLGSFGTRSEEGRHAGRGPKGYQRSDDRIREDACDALTADSHIDASNVTVRVEAGEVTLDGTVEDRRMKRRAEDCVEELPGVRQVHNRLVVQTASEQPGIAAQGGTATAAKPANGRSNAS
ncbi:MAG TPA: BON domain-containing protein [Candidatus Binatia bacterium]|jgi:osmotically-inducible protein OsmY|nr:BON domain-containing protein [Candidatus Binatia bacterium]